MTARQVMPPLPARRCGRAAQAQTPTSVAARSVAAPAQTTAWAAPCPAPGEPHRARIWAPRGLRVARDAVGRAAIAVNKFGIVCSRNAARGAQHAAHGLRWPCRPHMARTCYEEGCEVGEGAESALKGGAMPPTSDFGKLKLAFELPQHFDFFVPAPRRRTPRQTLTHKRWQ